jgi:hypothetical protein
MVQLTKGCQITQGTPWKIWTQTKTIWHGLTCVLSRVEQCRQTWLGATISHKPDQIFTWNSHKLDSPRDIEETLHKIFCEIRTFGCSASAWTRAEENTHMFDLSWCFRARPGARPRTPAPRDARPRAHASARAYKIDRGHDRTPPLALSPARARDRRSSLCARRASGHPSSTTVDQPLRPTSIQSNPSASLPRAP